MKKEMSKREVELLEKMFRQFGCQAPMKMEKRSDDSLICIAANATVIMLEETAYVVSGKKISVYEIESFEKGSVVKLYQEGDISSPISSSNEPTRLYIMSRARRTAVAAG